MLTFEGAVMRGWLGAAGAEGQYAPAALRQWGCGPIQTRTRSGRVCCSALHSGPRSSASWWESSVRAIAVRPNNRWERAVRREFTAYDRTWSTGF